MKQLTPRPTGRCAEFVATIALRAARGLLVLTCWALFLVALIAGGLAEMAGRGAARMRVR
jgi:hypothetical protein